MGTVPRVSERDGQPLPSEPLKWLADNGSAYRAHETRAFARVLGLEPCTTAVRSPENNRIAESFVKTRKRDYIRIMPKPDSRVAVMNLARAFSHYNEHHPHGALGYRSPREYIRKKLSQP
jgi:putative transposase